MGHDVPSQINSRDRTNSILRKHKGMSESEINEYYKRAQENP